MRYQSLLSFFILVLFPVWVFATPTSMTYQGQIIKDNGQPLEEASVVFTLQVYSPGSEECLLYEETQNINMTASRGVLVLHLGEGVQSGSDYEDTTDIETAFSNGVGTVNPTSCSVGGSYTPISTDGRRVRVSFDDGSGPITLSQDHNVRAVPYALNAQSINGINAAELLIENTGGTQVLTQANLETVFDNANYTELLALLAGTSTQYVAGSASSDLNLNNNKIENLATPTAGTDATNKNYVDQNIGGRAVNTTDLNTLGVPNAGEVLTWTGTQWESQAVTGSGDFLADGSVAMTGNFNASGNSLINIAQGSAAAPGMSFDSNTGVFSPAPDSLALSTAGNEVLTIDSAGDVGIGEATPNYTLHISDDKNADATGLGIISTQTGNLGQAKINFISDATTSLAIGHTGSGYSNSFRAALDPGESFLYSSGIGLTFINSNTSGAAGIRFITGGSSDDEERMVINPTGLIGIGSASPTSVLDVVGATHPIFERARTNNGSTSGAALRLVRSYDGGVGAAGIGVHQDFFVETSVEGTKNLVAKIGAEATDATAGSVDSEFYINVVNNGTGLEAMRINNLGRVGIGTDAPAVELDVHDGVINAASICDESNANCIDLSSGVATSTSSESGSSSSSYVINTDSDNTGSDGGVAIQTNGSTVASITATGNILSTGGSVSSPGLSFTGDSDTGIFSPAADTLSLSAGGVEGLRVNTVASGVNYVELTPATTGNGPVIAAGGSDTNIDLNITPKGTGNVLITSGSVGIGTTSPSSQSKLELMDSSWFNIALTNNDVATNEPSTDVTFKSNFGTTRGINAAASITGGKENAVDNDPRGFMSFATRASNNVKTEKMRIDSDGNLGIGTDEPDHRLHVYKNAYASMSVQAAPGSASGAAMGLSSPAGQQAFVRFESDDLLRWSIGKETSTETGSNTGSNLHIGRWDDSGNWIDSAISIVRESGYVGIGTNAPGNKLAVFGSDDDTKVRIVNSSSTSARWPGLDIYNYRGATGNGSSIVTLRSANGSSTSPSALVSGETAGVLRGSGYGATAQQTLADISFNAEGTISDTSAPGSIRLSTTASGSTTPTEHVRIDASGNVGIGTTAPGGKLSVFSDSEATTQLRRQDPDTDSSSVVVISKVNSAGAGADGIGAGILFRSETETEGVLGNVASINATADDATAGTEDGSLIFSVFQDAVENQALRILSNGNVGIGTGNPGDRLTVSGTDMTDGLRIINVDSS